ncbi:MAG: hypothetical protein GY827_10455 [Cytophagales bacterium]|nr:hypothetical protein [Cytophagales bacterium]
MKKVIFALLLTLAGLVTVNAQDNNSNVNAAPKTPGYIVIDIYEVKSYDGKGIHIHYGPGDTKVIPFKDFKKDNHDDNGELITKTLNELYAQGYRVVSMSSGAWKGGKITKIIMEYRR